MLTTCVCSRLFRIVMNWQWKEEVPVSRPAVGAENGPEKRNGGEALEWTVEESIQPGHESRRA